MTIKLTSPTHLDFSSYEGRDYLPKLSPGLYSTSLLSFDWSTGDLSPVSVFIGPKLGAYFQFSDKSRKPFYLHNVSRPTNFQKTGKTIFLSFDISNFLPSFITYATSYVNLHSRLLAKGQAQLAHLQALASTYPEHIL